MKRFTLEQAVDAVFAANRDLQNEFCDAGGPYDRLSCDANMTNTAGRCAIAEAGYLFGSRAFRGCRAFDNCFENGDGDQVVAHLVARAAESPILYRAIAEDFSGVFPQGWIATAARLGKAVA